MLDNCSLSFPKFSFLSQVTSSVQNQQNKTNKKKSLIGKLKRICQVISDNKNEMKRKNSSKASKIENCIENQQKKLWKIEEKK